MALRPGQNGCLHADTSICYAYIDISPRRQLGAPALHYMLFRRDRERSTRWHCVAGVQRKIHDRKLELIGIDHRKLQRPRNPHLNDDL